MEGSGISSPWSQIGGHGCHGFPGGKVWDYYHGTDWPTHDEPQLGTGCHRGDTYFNYLYCDSHVETLFALETDRRDFWQCFGDPLHDWSVETGD
ncbi:MAG: hypothetical protein KGZ25_13135 [Planctomycetes bacterium]|nr:hypothetical protein [Planctomycetota bacterium]